jgi:leader peptidase (prepilin peptidase) / N-methyltransferase
MSGELVSGAGVAPYAAWAAYGAFAAGSVALAVIDARTKRLPNRIVFPLYGIGVAGLALASFAGRDRARLVEALASMAVLYVFFYALAMFGPLGYGDVKLAGVLGLYLGWLGLPVLAAGLLLGTASGSAVSLGILVVKRARRERWRGTELPFGPFLLAGAWAAIIISRLR